jgi:hypothetical protein
MKLVSLQLVAFASYHLADMQLVPVELHEAQDCTLFLNFSPGLMSCLVMAAHFALLCHLLSC